MRSNEQSHANAIDTKRFRNHRGDVRDLREVKRSPRERRRLAGGTILSARLHTHLKYHPDSGESGLRSRGSLFDRNNAKVPESVPRIRLKSCECR